MKSLLVPFAGCRYRCLPRLILQFQPARVNISLERVDERRLVNNFMADVEHREKNQTDISGEEARDIEGGNPSGKALSDDNKNIEEQTIPRIKRIPSDLLL